VAALNKALAGTELKDLHAIESAVEFAGLEPWVAAELVLAGAHATAAHPSRWWAECLGGGSAQPIEIALRVATFGDVWVGVVSTDVRGVSLYEKDVQAAVRNLEVSGWRVCVFLGADQTEVSESDISDLLDRDVEVLCDDGQDPPDEGIRVVRPWELRPTAWVRCESLACAYAAAALGQVVVVDGEEELARLQLSVPVDDFLLEEAEELGDAEYAPLATSRDSKNGIKPAILSVEESGPEEMPPSTFAPDVFSPKVRTAFPADEIPDGDSSSSDD
jgi:hypothetical protein